MNRIVIIDNSQDETSVRDKEREVECSREIERKEERKKEEKMGKTKDRNE